MLNPHYHLWKEALSGVRSHIPIPAVMRWYISRFPKWKQVALYARTLVGKKVYRDVNPEVGCANCVSGILDLVDPSFFGSKSTADRIDGTFTLGEEFRRLEREGRMRRLNGPKAGAIILCRTGTGHSGSVGHVGIIDLDGRTIMSNSSLPKTLGLWIRNFTIDSWIERYEYLLGFKTEYWMIIK